jgi:hypothetical protein
MRLLNEQEPLGALTLSNRKLNVKCQNFGHFQVQLLPDLTGINITWTAAGTEADDRTQDILEKNAAKIRCVVLVQGPISLSATPNFMMTVNQVFPLES